MKKVNKMMIGVLAAAVMSTSWVAASAAVTQELQVEKNGLVMLNEENKSEFGSFTGKVKEIKPFIGAEGKAVEGWNYILAENTEGGLANFLVTPDTYRATENEAAVGANITGFYDATKPMIMIYPPQYQAEVIAVGLPEGQNIKVDRFDEDLVSEDGQLKLNPDDKTEIVLENGEAFKGELGGKTLAVLYGFIAKSLPAQTTPMKITVLNESPVPPAYEMTEEEKAQLAEMVSRSEIVVNNKRIQAPLAYVNEKGVIMVPLRAIAEALEYKVTWDEELQSVVLDKSMTITIGKDYYTYLKTAPIELGAAPEIIEGRTFVPMKFFEKVARMNNAYFFEGQVVVDNGEKMQ